MLDWKAVDVVRKHFQEILSEKLDFTPRLESRRKMEELKRKREACLEAIGRRKQAVQKLPDRWTETEPHGSP